MWDTTYRPLKFADVLGQDGAVKVLQARIRNGSAAGTSYIFSGGSGRGKCVSGDTLVSTDLGLVPIRDLMGPNQIDPTERKVLQEKGVASAAYTYRGGVRETIKVKTYHGFELEGTPNHRILVMTREGYIDWRRLDALSLGDQCCLLPKGLFGGGPNLSDWTFSREAKDHSSLDFTPPATVTPDLARLMGYLIGDGDCKSRKVVLACAESDIIRDQYNLLTSLFGSCSVTPDVRRGSLVAVRCFRVQARSFLRYCGVSEDSAGGKSVPWSVLQSPREVVREFLRGYLEADGGPVFGNRCVEFSSKSKTLVQQVQLLLLHFGVVGRMYPKTVPGYGVYWRCQIFGTAVAIFEREIGFVSARKSATLSRIVRRCRGLTQAIPHQKQHLKRYYRALPKAKRTRASSDLFRSRKDCCKTECSTQQLQRAVDYDPENPVSTHFNGLMQNEFVYSPVVSIGLGETEVYDLNVPEGERFAANGFINHNTTLARIFARALLCEDLDPDTVEPCNQCDQCEAILRDESVAFVERDAASQGTIEHVRGLVEDLPFAMLGAKKRIFLFDECFTEDTMLRTRHGLKSIKDIVDQQDDCEVLSFDPATQQPVWRPITDWFCIPDLRDLLRLTFDSGVVLVVTPDQELFTNNRGWVPASQLTEEDDIVEAIL